MSWSSPMLLAAAPLVELVENADARLAIWDEYQLAMQQQLVAEYSARGPYVTVHVEFAPNYWLEVPAAVSDGDPYDVMWMNGPNLLVFADSGGVLLSVRYLVERDALDLSPSPQALIDLHAHDGVLDGLPKDFDTVGLYYNVDLFDAAGLDYLDDTWTWDDLKNAAPALTTDDVRDSRPPYRRRRWCSI